MGHTSPNFSASEAVDSTRAPRVVGKLTGANLNVTTDQPITILGATKYRIRSIIVTNASTSLGASIAAGGVYTAATKGGTAIVAAGQVYTSLTGSTITLDATIAVGNVARTEGTLYFSLTVAHGSAATADVYVVADVLEI
jgi:hypothetical protein